MEREKLEPTEKTQNEARLDQKKFSLECFDVLGTLGSGTFSRVRLVKLKDYPSSSPMALKMLKKSVVLKLKQLDNLRNEKLIMEQLEHPFIPKLIGTFQDSRYIFMLMEFAHGGELFTRMKKQGCLPKFEAQFYAAELVLVLEYLSQKSIAFRDLKPENILLDRLGHIKLVDFGFSKVVEDKTYTMCGTPEYMAPEVILGKGHGKNADWWALGILIYEMLVGRPPFYDENPFNLYQKIILNRFNFPPELEESAKNLVSGLLEGDVNKRLRCKEDGCNAIKGHPWFRDFDFELMHRKEIAAPWVPELDSESDTSYFDSYPDSTEPPSSPLIDPDRDPFVGF